MYNKSRNLVLFMGWLILHPPLPIKGGEEGGESFTFEEPVVSVFKIKLELSQFQFLVPHINEIGNLIPCSSSIFSFENQTRIRILIFTNLDWNWWLIAS